MSTMTAAVPAKPAEAVRYLIARSYQSALNGQDATAYANLYTEDVLWAHPEIPDAHTREAVRKGIKCRFDAYSFQVAIKPVEIEVMGDFAYVTGRIKGYLMPKHTDPPMAVRYTVMWLLSKVGNDWKIAREIWNCKPLVPVDNIALTPIEEL